MFCCLNYWQVGEFRRAHQWEVELGGGFKYVLLSPRYPGKMIQFNLTNQYFSRWVVQPPTREARFETASAKSWGLGSLAGHAPFESKTGNAQETYGLVKRGIETVHFPGTVNLQAGVLVTWGRSG